MTKKKNLDVKDELLEMFGEGLRVDCSEKNKELLLGLGIPVYYSEDNFDKNCDDFSSIGRVGTIIMRSYKPPTDDLEFVIQGIKDNRGIIKTTEEKRNEERT